MSAKLWNAVAAIILVAMVAPSVVCAQSRLAHGTGKSRMTHGHARSKMVHSQAHQSSFGSATTKKSSDKK